VTRVVCTSDLHENWIDVPEGDVLLVAGDITYGFKGDYASQQAVLSHDFFQWAMEQPVEKVVVIAGNHDQSVQAWGWPIVPAKGDKIVYLEDEGVDVCGLRIWGTPWQPYFYSWAFNAPERHGERFLKSKFDLIPDETDIIVCHGPPYGYGDHEPNGMYDHLGYGDTQPRLGSRALADAVRRVDPSLMVCGHIHFGRGVYDVQGKRTQVVNAALVNNKYQAVHSPYVFDVESDQRAVAVG
jgi:Icc-related predicted phosphoesterase